MTFTPLPADPAAILHHLDDAALAQHAVAALRLLEERGTDLPPVLIDEVEEVLTEIRHRKPEATTPSPDDTARALDHILARSPRRVIRFPGRMTPGSDPERSEAVAGQGDEPGSDPERSEE